MGLIAIVFIIRQSFSWMFTTCVCVYVCMLCVCVCAIVFFVVVEERARTHASVHACVAGGHCRTRLFDSNFCAEHSTELIIVFGGCVGRRLVQCVRRDVTRPVQRQCVRASSAY